MFQLPKKKISRPWRNLLITAAALTAVIILFRSVVTLSEWYMQTLYRGIAATLSFFSSALPFSLFDCAIVAAILYILGLIIWTIVKKRPFGDLAYRLACLTVAIVGLFYFSWGFAYVRSDFYSRCDVSPAATNSEALSTFALRFIDDANRAYVDCSGLDRGEVPPLLEASYEQMHEALRIGYPNGCRRAKRMIFEPLFSRMGISGYFGPFFNEIHVNHYLLDQDYPFTLAHEMAHQFGIASEAECNLYAFVVCVNSSDARIRYSAYFSSLPYLINDAYALLSEAEADSIKAQIRPEIAAELKANRAHWLSAYDPTLANLQNSLYDLYLRGNNIPSGMANYSEMVGLLIASYDDYVH